MTFPIGSIPEEGNYFLKSIQSCKGRGKDTASQTIHTYEMQRRYTTDDGMIRKNTIEQDNKTANREMEKKSIKKIVLTCKGGITRSA
jgi:hypothetical protein